MNLLTAKDDFQLRTLAALNGAIPRLHYVAALRDAEGRYRHWGLARTYGEETAHDTVQQAHRGAFAEVLRTPVRKLYGEIVRWDVAGVTGLEKLLVELLHSPSRLLPEPAPAAGVSHLNSVLVSLLALVRARRAGSTRQGA